jgi:photosynthetic reaction center cytochrome c subunit
MSFTLRIVLAVAAALGVVFLVETFQAPLVDNAQHGYRGVAMGQVSYKPAVKAQLAANQVPPPEDKQDPSGQPSSEVYQNVQVLKDLDSNEFLRLMSAVTTWVAPNEGCSYCHTDNLAEDTLYTKRVARRMFQMVARINGGWKAHVGATGVTCYTCHRGQAVPSNIWFDDKNSAMTHGLAQEGMGKDHPATSGGFSSLPSDVFTPYLNQTNDVRVISTAALPGEDRHSIKQTEWTYGLMMHISSALGVNCTYCHNSRAFADWDQSTPQRVTAWYGIRMVRDLNDNFLDPLASTFPKTRLGPLGDGPKLNCATCHAGANKPLLGVSMLQDYPELNGAGEAAVIPPPSTPTQ